MRLKLLIERLLRAADQLDAAGLYNSALAVRTAAERLVTK